jgi:hypothetical protein
LPPSAAGFRVVGEYVRDGDGISLRVLVYETETKVAEFEARSNVRTIDKDLAGLASKAVDRALAGR